MNTQLITYKDNDTVLEGFLALDSSWKEKRPAIILCHAWRGRDEFVCEQAKEITKWGYVGFALDVYGKGVLGTNKEENTALMSPFMEDRNFLQNRLLSALKTVQQLPSVDSSRIAVLGFCFGGLCALDLARSGANIKGAISMHGLFIAPEKSKKHKIQAKILALHGHDDPLVPPEQVAAFEKEMTSTHADWQLHIFGNTMHAFTNPIANDPAFGTVYNPVAAARAWIIVQNFLKEIF